MKMSLLTFIALILTPFTKVPLQTKNYSHGNIH